MPCRSDHMEQTAREKYKQETAILYMYAIMQTNGRAAPEVALTASDYYAKTDYTKNLCRLLRGLSEANKERIIYNPHDARSRRLADWWEDHQKVDAKHAAEDAAKDKKLRNERIKLLARLDEIAKELKDLED